MALEVLNLADVVQQFKDLIEADGGVYTAFNEMFRQAAVAEATVAAEVAAEVAAAAAAAVEVARAADEAANAAESAGALVTADVTRAAAAAAKTAAAAARTAAVEGTAQAARDAAATAKNEAQAAQQQAQAAQQQADAAQANADAAPAAVEVAAAAAEAAAATNVVAEAAETAGKVAKAEAQVEDYVELMRVINTILLTAPKYAEGPSAMVAGVPFYGVIARFCNTAAGYEAFTHPGVNERFCNVFTAWRLFLRSAASTNVIHAGDGGWRSRQALRALIENAGVTPAPDADDAALEAAFRDIHICPPGRPATLGFPSYDAFFVRELRDDHRNPVVPDGTVDAAIVNSPCSSTVHKLYRNLRKTERFWIKNTPYSLRHILAGDQRVDTFVGGTLLQAMLGSRDYHRWRSPVSGDVVATRLISGMTPLGGGPPAPHPTYYAACLDDNHIDLDVVSRSQDFVTAISTRALIFIRAPPPVGLVCFVAVGLGEVSTCQITVNVGDDIRKGRELGRFRFGGSTYCLIFRRGLNVMPRMQGPNNDQPLVGSKVRVGKDILDVA